MQEIWLPSCQDSSPLDYFVQGFCKLHVNRAPNNTDASQVKIKEVMGNIGRDTDVRACQDLGDARGKLHFLKIELP